MLQSTLPKWVETKGAAVNIVILFASIHSTQMGRDGNYTQITLLIHSITLLQLHKFTNSKEKPNSNPSFVIK